MVASDPHNLLSLKARGEDRCSPLPRTGEGAGVRVPAPLSHARESALDRRVPRLGTEGPVSHGVGVRAALSPRSTRGRRLLAAVVVLGIVVVVV